MSRQHEILEAAATKDGQERIWDAFRRWGFLQAKIDPQGDVQPVAMPDLDVTGPEGDAARRFYCGSIGAEFMHIADAEKREWIQARMEAEAPEVDRARILDWLVRAEIFEQVLQTRYLGTKRYSLEGEASLLPLLDSILGAGANQGAKQAVGARRREVPHGRDRKFRDRRRTERGDAPGFESEPPGSGRPGGGGTRASKTATRGRHGTKKDCAGDHARRRGVRRAGNSGGNAEHVRRRRIYGGGLDSRGGE